MATLGEQKLLSGRSVNLGQGIPKEVPIQLDPKSSQGAIVSGTDKLMYYSSGDKWVGLAPVLSTIFDAGNAATDYSGNAVIDLGGAQS
jgi:hypothetical protein